MNLGDEDLDRLLGLSGILPLGLLTGELGTVVFVLTLCIRLAAEKPLKRRLAPLWK